MKQSYASLGEGLVNEVDAHHGELVSICTAHRSLLWPSLLL